MICDRCRKPLDVLAAHWDHKDECPRSHGVAMDEADCDCDLSVHPECCGICTHPGSNHSERSEAVA